MNDPKPAQDSTMESPPSSSLAIIIYGAAAVLRKWRFLLVSTVLVGGVSAGLILMMPETWTSTATVLVSEKASVKSGALSMLKESGLSSLLGGMEGEASNLPLFETILDTRELAFWAVRQYKLDSIWSKGDKTPMRPENMVRNWNANFTWEELKTGGLTIGFTSPKPELSQEIVRGTLQWLDSSFRALARQTGAVREEYLNSRLAAQLKVIDSLQDSIAAFQVRHKILSPTSQVEDVARGAGEIEIGAERLDLDIRSAAVLYGDQSSKVQQMVVARNQMRDAARRLLEKREETGLIRGLSTGIRSGILLARMQKQLQAQAAVYAYLLQQREQYALDMTKDLPSLTIVDHPIIPKKRTSPPRTLLFQTIVILWVLSVVAGIVMLDGMRRSPMNRQVQEAWATLLRALPGRGARRKM